MKTVVELKERNRVTLPLPLVQGLALRVGDLVEINVEVVRRAALRRRARLKEEAESP
jgi:hypothetical protein